MKITINGDEREIKQKTSLSTLIEELGISCNRVAVERNHHIVPPGKYDQTELQAGDNLEIVSFVGGG
jgi:sulfur carrier protein